MSPSPALGRRARCNDLHFAATGSASTSRTFRRRRFVWAGVAEAGPFKNLEMIDSQRAASDDDRMGFVRNSNSKLSYACLDAAQVPRLSPWQVRDRPNSGLPTSM